MHKASLMTPTLAIAAACALGACRNGPKNARDTTGYNENSAAGQVQIAPGTAGTGGATMDSTGAGTAATTGTGVAGSALPGAVSHCASRSAGWMSAPSPACAGTDSDSSFSHPSC